MFLIMRLRTIVLFLGISVVAYVLVGLMSPIAYADARYGDNIYGQCPYGQACPSSSGSPSPTETPSPSPSPTPTTSTISPNPGTDAQDDSGGNDNGRDYTPGGGTISPAPPGGGSASNDFLSSLEKTEFGRFLINQPATIPIIFFILLLIMALILAIQAGFEHRSVIQLRRAVARLTELQSDVKNFLLIFQHNLRTPLTGLMAALELLLMKKTSGADTTLELAKLLNNDVNAIITDTVTSLETIALRDEGGKTGLQQARQTVVQPSFWGPVVTVVVLAALYHVLTWRLIRVSFNTQLLILELAVLFAAVVVLLVSIAYRRRTKERKTVLDQVARDAHQLAEKRDATVTRLHADLSTKYELVSSAVAKLPETHESLLVKSTLEDFGNILHKLAIVESVQAPDAYVKMSVESYDLEQEMHRVIEAVRFATITKLQINLDSTALKVKTHQGAVGLVNFVLASALDNAVKYSTDGSNVRIRMVTGRKKTLVEIENHTSNVDRIDSKKIFKPFTRFEDGLTSEVKGVGISLFVSAITLKVLGGNIVLETKKPDLVLCKIWLPHKVLSQNNRE